MATISNRCCSIIVGCFISFLAVITDISATSETKVITTAPVHPVKEGAILSLHCQISNLALHHYVTISRQLDNADSPQILSWGDDILGSIGDSVFLAVRQLNDGTIIYFLSIVGVTIQDQGSYICKVMPSTQDSVIAMDSTDIKIQYFPKDPNPFCTPKEQSLTVNAGASITLNCTSESAYPKVTMEWSRTGTGSVPKSVTVERNGMSYTELRLRASLSDNEAVFLCQITSPSFPGIVKSCHVGPISVLSNPNENFVPTNHADDSSDLPQIFYPPFPAIAEPANPTTSLQLYTDKDNNRDIHKPVTDCREVCSAFSSPKFFWIVATVVACALAFIFFIMGASLLWKYRQAHAQQRTYYSTNAKPFPAHPTREYIYTELDSKRGVTNNDNIGSCVYMSLERRENHDKQTDLPMVKSTKD